MSDDVDRIAEAVLYEGYLLFPYRRSAMKNQRRWTFGGVYPRQYSDSVVGTDPWRMQTQCLVEGGVDTLLDITIRFLHLVDRRVAEIVVDDGLAGAPHQHIVEWLRVGERVYRPWEEAVERDVKATGGDGDVSGRIGDLLGKVPQRAFSVPAGQSEEPLIDAEGGKAGALIRTWGALQGSLELSCEPVSGASGPSETTRAYRVTVTIANSTPWTAPEAGSSLPPRDVALRKTLISTHTILRATDGAFVSLLEPPAEYRAAADACENIKTWPVLVGQPGERHVMLSSPIILYDYPTIAPESHGNFFDATEIDELLTLSVLALTDDEKLEMRESDARGREMLERTEALSPEQVLQLHGVMRDHMRPRTDTE